MRISDWSSDVCSSDLREVVLRAGFVAFLIFAAVAWSSFFAAYALGDASLEVRSLFGMTSGNLVPTSAALIKESTVIEFTRRTGACRGWQCRASSSMAKIGRASWRARVCQYV